MKKVFLALGAFALNTIGLQANELVDTTRQIRLDEVTVSAVRVGSNSSVAHSNMDESTIKSNNVAKNIPALLQTLPSVVSYTEGGTPVGNTSFRIRGTDANRINVTLNGMPLNNPESQDVFWVNLPDLSSSLKNIQVQRGVGTSSTGTASFGGNISMQSTAARPNVYADLSTGFGQYNTFIGSMAAGSGIMSNGLSIDARYSYITSDGYIRNGNVDHKSLYTSVSYYTGKQSIQLIYMNGIQHTGITWGGISPEQLKINRRYNSAGEYKDGDTTKYYDNETDNYYSNILQLAYSYVFNNQLKLSSYFSYNSGSGYYENYKPDQKFSKFGLQPQLVDSKTYKASDVIRRKLMSNDFYTGGANINYSISKSFNLIFGANYSFYDGNHFGRLLWVKHNENIVDDYEWYRNKGMKKDFNTFVKMNYSPIESLTLSVEAQGRFVNYRLNGVDDDLGQLKWKDNYNFFNPKLGLSYTINQHHNVYTSFAISNREPLRADLKESVKGDKAKPIKSERLYDYELGYRYQAEKIQVSGNFYYMSYDNQLVQTGRLSDSGYKYQENVPDSYRYGLELEAMYNPAFWLGLGGNVTLSRNKIKGYTAYYDYYDDQTNWTELGQISEYYQNTNISFSPNVIGAAILKIKPMERENLDFSFIGKYVGRMYYDNTSNKDNELPSYFVTDFQVSYNHPIWKAKNINLQFLINNLFNKMYSANASTETVKFADGSQIVYTGLFPQAGINVMGKVGISF